MEDVHVLDEYPDYIIFQDGRVFSLLTCNFLISQQSKCVVQLSLDGELIQKFSSISEAAQAINLSNSTISRYCNGKRKDKNFIWKFENFVT